jgi:hypothetical protein
MPTAVRPRAAPADVFDRIFRTAPHILSSRRADATVLLDSRQGLCYSLNELGWRIWDQIGAGQPVSEVIRTLRQEYDVPPDSFEADVAGFVDYLLKASLIEPMSP